MNRQSDEATKRPSDEGADVRKLSPWLVRLPVYLGLIGLAVLSILVIDGRAMQRQAELLDEYEARKTEPDTPSPEAGKLQSPRAPRTDDDN